MRLFTVGHSNLPFETFLSHLRERRIETVIDIRTIPFSRRFPWFHQQQLELGLKANGMDYLFEGQRLGGRPEEDDLYTDGIANYQKMAMTSPFRAGIEAIMAVSTKSISTLMCSEGDPLACHRTLLVGRELASLGADIQHILRSGKLISQSELEDRLLEAHQLEPNLLESREESLTTAYALQNMQAAYRKS